MGAQQSIQEKESDIDKVTDILTNLSEELYLNEELRKEPKVKELLAICKTLNKYDSYTKSSNPKKLPKNLKNYIKSTKDMCYICRSIFETPHHFYESMCNTCGEINYTKRDVRIDLTGKIAIVTGARIKIGFYTALQLLRCNVQVIITTRFANDALKRYKKELDYDTWKDNLEIYQVNFRYFDQVSNFIIHIKDNYSKLDYLIHNAAQTLRRPYEFYEHIINAIQVVDDNSNIKKVFGEFEKDFQLEEHKMDQIEYQNIKQTNSKTSGRFTSKLNDTSLVIADINNKITTKDKQRYFPANQLDEHSQQKDMRDINTWVLDLHQVNPIETFEVHMINAIVPSFISGRLKDMLKKSENDYSWIINVSSMEGSFSRKNKTTYHPHTNMAKASLNMMTRTCGKDYIRTNTVMVSVDTGWNTIEQPKSYDCKSPIDCVDGAARILDPIFRELKTHSIFYKDFRQTFW